jgi:hypothetical protein
MGIIKKAFTSERGVIDLPSVMAGVIIVGILSIITVASLTLVVPWFQEQGAKDNIAAVNIAETSARQDAFVYVDYPTLKSKNYIVPRKDMMCVNVIDAGKGYEVYTKQGNGVIRTYSTVDETIKVFAGTLPCVLS